MTGVQTCALPISVVDRASRGLVGTMSQDILRATGKAQMIDYGPFLSASVLGRYPAGNTTNKGIAIRVGANRDGTMLFDTDLLRWSAGWTEGFVTLAGVAFNGVHGQNPAIDGKIGFVTSPVPGWTSGTGTPDFSDARPDRKSTRLNSSHIPLSRMPSSA